MARDATAIYVDDSAVRVFELSGKRPKLWASERLEPGLVRDGFVVDEAEVSNKIKSLWSSKGIGARRVVAGISGINCMYRFLTLPDLPRSVLPEAVSREASRAFGVPVDQLYISWQDLPGKPGETLVYVVAASRSTVDGLIRTLRKAGLNPYLMDIAPLAISRSTAAANALIVDLQPATLDVIVKMDGLPEVIRSVSVPHNETASANLQSARQELQRAVTFYNSGHPDTPIGDDIPILLGGLLADEPDLWPEMLGRVERRVEAAATPLEDVDAFSPQAYMPLIGLALKETVGKTATPYSRINFNALPEAYQPKPRPLSELLYPPVLVAGIAALAFGGYILYNTWNHTQALSDESVARSELAMSLGTELTGRKQALEEQRDSLTGHSQSRETRAASLEGEVRRYDTTKDRINGDLGEIHRTPAGVDLDMVNHSISVVDVSGWGDSETAVFSFARQLRSSGRFSQVVITSMSVDGIETWFTFVCYKA